MNAISNNFDKIKPIYAAHWKDLCGFLHARFDMPPDPEDIAQATFIKFADLDDPDSVDNPKAYLFKTARNLVVDYHRSPKNLQATESQINSQENENNSDDLRPENVLMGREEADIVEQVIMSLPERDRAFLLMHRLEDLTYTEIAKRANMSRSGVQKIINQALERCTKALKQRTDI